MAYCTRAQIELRYGETNITAFAKMGESASDATILARITAAIVDADDAIDLALGSMYSVPFTTVPTRIESISIDLAASFLYDSSGVVDWGEDGEPRNRMSFAAKRGQKWLGKILSGQVMLPVADADKPDLAPAVVEDTSSNETTPWVDSW